MRVRRFALLAGATLVLMAAFAGLALAQDAGLTAQVVEVKDAGYPKAQAVVTVDDTASGSPALTAADFTVALDGQPATVSAASLASSETAPLDVLFVIDTSGSMAGVPIAQVKAAASAFIGQLAAQDRVAVMAFSDKVRLVQDYTTDHPAAASIIRGLQAAGNTALYQATAGAALKAASSPASRRAIILLSDGADYGSDGTVSREVAVDAVTKVGVPFFAIGEGTDIDAAYLQQLGSASNGRYLQAPDPRQLTDLYAGIARLLRSQYIVTFDAGAISSARTAQVVVTVTSNGRKATSSVNYAAAAPPAAGITIAGVADGESVRSARAITVDVMGVQPSGVTFSVDGQEVARSTARPFAFHFDPKAFSAGAHTLTVRVDLPSGSAVVTRAFASAVPSAGGSFDLLTLGVAVAAPLLVLLTFAFVIVRRRRRRGVAAPHAAAHIASMRARAPALPSPAEPEAPLDVVREVVEEPKGLLISRAGSDLGSEYIIGGIAVSVGSGERCAVRIDDRGLSAVEARVWVRGRQLMLHRITSINALANEGVTGGWVILDVGDTFDIGPHSYEFRLLEKEKPPAPPSVAHDILRDDSALARPSVAPTPPAGAQAEAPSLRLVELMPKNDIQAPPEPEERAS